MSRKWLILTILLLILMTASVVVTTIQLTNRVKDMVDALDTCMATNAGLLETVETYEGIVKIYQDIVAPGAE